MYLCDECAAPLVKANKIPTAGQCQDRHYNDLVWKETDCEKCGRLRNCYLYLGINPSIVKNKE